MSGNELGAAMETCEKILEAIAITLEPISVDIAAKNSRLLAQKTIDSYQNLYKCALRKVDFENGIELIDVIFETNSKNTYFSRIAAFRFVLLNLIESQLKIAKNAAIISDKNQILSAEAEIHMLTYHFLRLKSLEGKCALPVKKPRKSKRNSSSGLVVDWREQLCLRAGASKYFNAILTASLTGCRPVELSSGINFRIDKFDGKDFLVASINGAKITQKNGQPNRELFFALPGDSHLIRMMSYAVTQNGGTLNVQIDNAKTFSGAVTRFAKLLWPKHKTDITAYSLRHAFASDLKSSVSVTEIAAALGHASTKTQKSYGQRQQSRSIQKSIPQKILATRPIREASSFIIGKFSNQSATPDFDI